MRLMQSSHQSCRPGVLLSLFVRPDGLLVGYVETEDFDAAQRAMAATEVNDRWQSEMAAFFGERADEGLVRLEEVFHLD